MVFFTFDDAITPQVAGFYRQLFDSSRRNPNGCPVSMTLFISHSNTVYSLVREFYQKGMEIASHSVSHAHPNTQTFKSEAMKQKQNLARMARIPHTRISGWRSPFLEPLGDAQPNMLQELGYAYDATLTISKKSLGEKPPLPFTLDYGWPYDCKIKPCPKSKHKGFWEVPVISLMDYLQRFDCVYVDGCNNPPPDEEAAYRFLWDNFQSYYKTNKAPFGVNMHASWFFYPDRLKAMDRFINELVKMDDVYIVNVKQVIEWLRHPVSLQDVSSFTPWSCNSGNDTSSKMQTAFDLRNKQIEQRLKELRQQRFEKNEQEFLHKQHTWARQQAAKKAAQEATYRQQAAIKAAQQATQQAAARYSMYQNIPPHLPSRNQDIYRRPVPNRSPAMTWQQMLMAHARKQHALSLGNTNPQTKRTENIPKTVVDPLAPRRFVKPVNQMNDPKRREMMIKEERRIREQQRIAAENRMKESQSDQNSIHTVTDNKHETHSKETHEIAKQIVKSTNHDVVGRTHNEHKPVASIDKVPVQHIKSEFKEARPLNNIVPTKTVVVRPFKPNVIGFKSIRNSLANVPQIQRRGPIVVQKPNLHHAVETPVKRERIKSINDIEKSQDSKESTTNKDDTNMFKQQKSMAPKVRMIGGSWNLFNVNDPQMKMPWSKWISDVNKDKTPQVSKSTPEPILPPSKSLSKAFSPKQLMIERKPLVSPVRQQMIKSMSSSISSSRGNNDRLQNLRHAGQDKEVVLANQSLQNVSDTRTDSIDKQQQQKPNTSAVIQKTTQNRSSLQSKQSAVRSDEKPTSFVRKPSFINSKQDGLPGHMKNRIMNGLSEIVSRVIARRQNMTIPLNNSREIVKLNTSSTTGDVNDTRNKVNHVSTKVNNVTRSDVTLGKKVAKTEINLTLSGHKTSNPKSNTCQQDVNCFLPDCFCMTDQNDFGIKRTEIPQIVFITIEGAVNFLSYSKMRSLFNQQRLNPNGCPIGSTFFLSEQGSSYSLVRNLQRYGTEIAINAGERKKSKNIESFKSDLERQMDNLEKHVGRTNDKMVGWRKPELDLPVDDKFQVLRNKTTRIYDSSVVLDRSMRPFPFTLDYGLQQACNNKDNCNIGKHPGLWEVPIIPLIGLNQSETCSYADSCKKQPSSTEDTFQFLMNNFEKYYLKNRAPFGLHLKQNWFHWSTSKNLAALSQFLDKLLAKNDIYVITVSDMLDWMKNPTKLSEIDKLWKC